MYLIHRLADTFQHRIHALAADAGHMLIRLQIVADILGRQDAHEFLSHEAARSNGNLRAARNLDFRVHLQHDRDAHAIRLDALDLADADAGKAHRRTRIQAHDLRKADIQRIILVPAQAESTQMHQDKAQQGNAQQGKCPDLRLVCHSFSSPSAA